MGEHSQYLYHVYLRRILLIEQHDLDHSRFLVNQSILKPVSIEKRNTIPSHHDRHSFRKTLTRFNDRETSLVSQKSRLVIGKNERFLDQCCHLGTGHENE